MKLAAVVILYQPPEHFIRNILSYYPYVEKLYVFDNTEAAPHKSYFEELDKVVFLYDGENEGLAKRLNQGCALAAKDGYEWLLTMDQDSHFAEAAITHYLHCIMACRDDAAIALLGVTPSDIPDKPATAACQGIDTPLILTSGSVLNIAIANKLGGFNEQLFIDGVDMDFCFKANRNGYRTIRFENIFLLHQVGQLVYRAAAKTLFLAKKRKWIHGPLRCYYILRNTLYLQKEYGTDFPDVVRHHIFLVNKHLQRSLWYGRSFFKTWWYMQKAKQDFKSGVMGKFSHRQIVR